MLIPRELYVAPSGSVLVTGMGGYQVIAAPNAEGERAVGHERRSAWTTPEKPQSGG